jgi:hypothetical protein
MQLRSCSISPTEVDKPWKVIAAFVAVFMAGAVFGGLFTLRAFNKRFADWRATERQAAVSPVVVPPPTTVAAKAGATPPPAAAPAKATIQPALMQQFTKRLKLTPAQRDRIRPIVGRASEDMQRLRQENESDRQRNLADTVRLTERMYADVAALLSPDQREELETMRQQMQERADMERKRRTEISTAIEAAMKAERAANQASENESKASAPTPNSTTPTAKPAGGK